MKKNIGALLVVVGFLVSGVNIAYAETTPISITLQLESTSGTIFNGPLDVSACPETQGSATTTVNAFCALEQSGIPVTWSWYGDDAFLDTLSGVGNDYGLNLYWLWFTDLEPGATSFNKHTLHSGEKILVTIGRMPMKFTVSTTTPYVGATTTVTVSEFGFDSSWNSVWLPSASSTVSFGGEVLETDAFGQAVFTAVNTNPASVSVSKNGFLVPESTTITPVPAPVPATPITLQLESTSGTIFNGPLDVSVCPETQGSATTTVNAFCALEQSGIPVTWSWYGDDAFLDTLSGVGNDYGLNLYWLWFTDLEPGATSFNKHTLHSGEKILVTIGRMPMKFTVSTTTPYVGATTTVTVSEFGFDSSWNSVWLPSASSTVSFGGEVYTSDVDGVVNVIATSTEAVMITVSKNNFLTPDSLSITPVVAPSVVVPTPDPAPVSSGGGGGGGVVAHAQFNTPLAYGYLSSVVRTDGSFGSDMVTDWVAIALGDRSAPESLRNAVRAYLISHTPVLVSATDYERHAMALLALGIDPQNAGGVNYIQKIITLFDGTQVGDTGLVNDDVFALFPLAHTGYTASDDVVKKTVQFIVSKQSSDGSWDSIDMTAAAIQALSLFPGESGVADALSRARGFLKAHQNTDAGWWNTFSTSWTMQAVTALGESITSWQVGSNAPQDTLQSVQQSDGGVGPVSGSEMTRVWATALAIPAVGGKSWHVLMTSFSKISPSVVSGGSAVLSIPEKIATSTLVVATTTKLVLEESFATTTTAVFTATTTEATSTPVVVALTKPKLEKKIAKQASTTIAHTAPQSPIAQRAQVPENRIGGLILDFFVGFGNNFKSFLSWIF